MKDILANPDKPWNYTYLSRNPNIAMEDVLANPRLPWSYYYLSINPNITIEVVLANPEKEWDYQHLSRNRFNIKEKESKARIVARTQVFKEELMMVCWNPARISHWWTTEGMDEDYV